MTPLVRRARTADVRAVRAFIDVYADDRRLLSKQMVTLYEDVQEFWVAEIDGVVVGCGALHVMWEDLAEVRTLAISPAARGQGIGGHLIERLMLEARTLGVTRVFCLTFETAFFARHGFRVVTDEQLSEEVAVELRRSADEGVAEFLDLPRVRPNTLGNTRMFAVLT